MRIIKLDKLEDYVFRTFNTIFMICLVIVTLYPFLNTIAVSFNEGLDTIRGGIFLLPRKFTWQNYRAIFSTGTVYHAFYISLLKTSLNTVLGVFLCAMLAYPLSRKEYVFRKQITTILVLTMYFSAGLIPGYMLIKYLGLVNNFWVYVIPSLISAFNVIVIRTYIGTIPESLVESARIDGAGEFRIFLQIIFPLCKPVLATVALFIAVGAWNSWFDTFLYAPGKQELSTIQYELMKLLASTTANNADPALRAGVSAGGEAVGRAMVTPASIRAAITVVAAAPILMVYPFLQKYFVVGLNVGGVKE
ncbi:MAG: carbohydrate ABC transporter permease [Epulopiscium sp.]|nr:carbohydrate ABC transporter permease [Candidatus Epulonipiscium sp.]